ncbi:MAG TPA: EVE domain-containing protein [Edaphocola sp.]|nr:EVE domain-containing protein [Edaphocola sp.]
MKYWLVKSEPFKYSWEQLLKDGQTFWDGVRNYQARNNLREMKIGDKILFYHSNEGLCVVGIAEVAREAYPDPTIDDERWVAVDIRPLKALPEPVTLKDMKMQQALAEMGLIRQGRLSVVSLTKKEFGTVLKMGGLAPGDI